MGESITGNGVMVVDKTSGPDRVQDQENVSVGVIPATPSDLLAHRVDGLQTSGLTVHNPNQPDAVDLTEDPTPFTSNILKRRNEVPATDSPATKRVRHGSTADLVSLSFLTHNLAQPTVAQIDNFQASRQGPPPFFRSQHRNSNFNTSVEPIDNPMVAVPPADTAPSLAALSVPLQLPDAQKLTRSERLFSMATQIDVRALSIKDSEEFFLFMEMRAEKAWVSFNMTSQRWVHATHQYNQRLQAMNIKKNCDTIKKNPRALLDLLGDVEMKISNRIAKNNYVCKYFKFLLFTSLLISF